MKITIISVGKIKERYWNDAIAEYEKRLSKYCRLQFIVLPDEKTPDGASEVQEEQIKAKEGERILKQLDQNAYIVSLAIEGKMLSSTELSKQIDQLGIQGVSHIQLIIGGSLGLDSRVLKKSDFLLSFSKMTFPHQMMKVVLLEQIYRSYRIIKGEPYHK